MTRSLDTIFADIKAAGWKVSNLFELNTGMWQCNVRRSNDMHNGGYTASTEFCMGATPNEAAEGCLVDMGQPRNNIRPPLPLAGLEYKMSGGRSVRSKQADLDKLIDDSGL